MYDIDKAFRESGASKDEFEEILRYCREDFPQDEMMFELHVIRALMALKRRNQ